MTTFTSTYNNVPGWLSRLSGTVCLLLLLLCGTVQLYANDTGSESVTDEYGQSFRMSTRADGENKVKHSYTRYKKHFYIPSRRFFVEPSLKQDPLADCPAPLQLADNVALSYSLALSAPARPSYYLLLFLYALF